MLWGGSWDTAEAAASFTSRFQAASAAATEGTALVRGQPDLDSLCHLPMKLKRKQPKSITQFILQVSLSCKVVCGNRWNGGCRSKGNFEESRSPFRETSHLFFSIEAQEDCGKSIWRKEKRGRQMQPFRPTALRPIPNTERSRTRACYKQLSVLFKN